MDEIRNGVRRFQMEVFPQRRHFYEGVAASQSPRALFLTCGDSRIDPELLTSSGPGEIFVERNPGNLVPVYDERSRVGVSASIEYALSVLQVRQIIICGHSNCGAMKALMHPEKLAALPAVRQWLSFAEPALEALDRDHRDDADDVRLVAITRLNVLLQIKNLETHPAVADGLRKGRISVDGWVYEIHTGKVEAFNSMTGRFEAFP
ncbi:MAG TPA: carbonic anhydrase [Phycisphaerae bacterium]|nr:carbonic anhydrase [Phycisphaerae bacterium]